MYPELDKAVEVGYVILETHEVAHFPSKKQGLFESYVDCWLKLKVEASGWPVGPARDPNHPERQIECDAYVSNFARHEGVHLDPDNIKKMMSNSMWGKFGQRDNLMQHKVFYDPQPFGFGTFWIRTNTMCATSAVWTNTGWKSTTKCRANMKT